MLNALSEAILRLQYALPKRGRFGKKPRNPLVIVLDERIRHRLADEMQSCSMLWVPHERYTYTPDGAMFANGTPIVSHNQTDLVLPVWAYTKP